MYEYKNGIACVPATLLYKDLKIISEGLYRDSDFRKDLDFVQRGGNGRKALIAYKSLPPEIKNKLVEKIGKPTENNYISRVESFYEERVDVRHFFETYELPDGRPLKDEQQDEYTKNVCMLLALEQTVNETILTRRAGGGTKGVNWKALTKTVDRLRYKQVDGEYLCKHTLPKTERRLREAYNKVKGGNYGAIIRLGKYGNVNKNKVKTDEQKYLLQELLGHGRNLDNETVTTLYNGMAEVKGWESITSAAVADWRAKLKHVIEPGRRGVRNYKNTLSMQAKRSKPSAPLYFWSADGWTAELFYQETEVSKATGTKRTTYTNRLTIVVIIDAFNGYPVGYAIGDKESVNLIEDAMRNALNHTRELFGKRYKTWQIQSDNFQHKRLAPSWEALGDKWTPAEVGNAKAKPIESWFKHEMQKRCQLSVYPNWAGYGITSKSDNQVNDDWINANKKHFPDRMGCFCQLEQIISDIRKEKRVEFIGAFNSLPDKDKLPLSDELYLYKFGSKTLPNRLKGQGLTPTVDGIERYYDCFDLKFRDHSRERWVIHYDPEDTSKALAVAYGKEDIRFMVEEKYIQPMALKDRTERDSEELKRIREYNKQDMSHIIEKRAKGAEVVYELMMQHKELDGGILSRVLVPDSNGQHKINKYKDAEDVEYEHVDSIYEDTREYLKAKANLKNYIE